MSKNMEFNVRLRSWERAKFPELIIAIMSGWEKYISAHENIRPVMRDVSYRYILAANRKHRDPKQAYNIVLPEETALHIINEFQPYGRGAAFRMAMYVNLFDYSEYLPMNDPHRVMWQSVTLPTSLCFQASQALNGKAVKELLPLAFDIWQALPDQYRAERLASFGVQHDKLTEREASGIVQTKLRATDWEILRMLGNGNRSRGARIVLRTLLALLKENPS